MKLETFNPTGGIAGVDKIIKTANQGDIVFFALGGGYKLSDDAMGRSFENGMLPLEEGELTGHFHCVLDEPPVEYLEPEVGVATLFDDANLCHNLIRDALLIDDAAYIGFMRVEGGAIVLQHATSDGKWAGEHNPIIFPVGLYYVGGQTEMDANEIRRVAD